MTTPKVLDRMILVLATFCLAARQYGVPSGSFWAPVNDRPYVILGITAVIGIFGALTPFQTFADRGLSERREAIRRLILNHFGQILVQQAQASPSTELGDLGLHIWRVKRFPSGTLRSRLVRISTYRLGTAPATRSFAPLKGVGVVGLCWKRNEEVSVDVESLSSSLSDKGSFDAFKARNGEDAVMGLSWEDYLRVRHRGAVFASPIRNSTNQFIGCVSLDGRTGYATLDRPAVWHELNSLCAGLGDDGLRHI